MVVVFQRTGFVMVIKIVMMIQMKLIVIVSNLMIHPNNSYSIISNCIMPVYDLHVLFTFAQSNLCNLEKRPLVYRDHDFCF